MGAGPIANRTPLEVAPAIPDGLGFVTVTTAIPCVVRRFPGMTALSSEGLRNTVGSDVAWPDPVDHCAVAPVRKFKP